MQVYLIAGRMFSGKSTVAKELWTTLFCQNDSLTFTSIKICRFAEGVKQVARDGFGWDGVKDEKGRRLLQVVGTECGRDYNKNIWAEKAYTDNKGDILIFDDWRFPNEYEVWLDKPEVEEIFKIRVFREREEVNGHASEISLPDGGSSYYDYMFDNNIDIAEIPKKVDEMIFKLNRS